MCLDYTGHGLFSYSQLQAHNSNSIPFFNASYKSVNLHSHVLSGGHELEFESVIRKRIMGYMNISEDDYAIVFTANHSSAFKILADSYPFNHNKNLLTVYDYRNEAVQTMIDSSKKNSAQVNSAEFSWPNMKIRSRKLMKAVKSKRKKKGLFVFPLESKITGARYSYLWMSMAQENGWHVLLDATSLGAKDMETLGLSLIQPNFLICSFYKIFGENPSGFGCLFVKKSSASVLDKSTSVGIVSLVPAIDPLEGQASTSQSQEIVEQGSFSKIEFRGLDHADSLGLILISSRTNCLVNWLVNALTSLQHPNAGNGLPLIKIYGPNIKLGRGPSVAFNLFDWKGQKVDPVVVQKLAGRNNISLGIGYLDHIWFPDKQDEKTERLVESTSSKEEEAVGVSKKIERLDIGVVVVTASIGLLTNFEDTYRVWAFVSRFLDADFVEKERWRYMALNRRTVEV